MLLRQEKGLEIATRSQIRRITGGWLVPSQTRRISYRVHDYGRERTCTCPDAKFRHGMKCKHVWAVEYWMTRSVDMEGNETISRGMKLTYAQEWSAYNNAQITEGETFMQLLASLCKNLEQPKYEFGRPRKPISDMVFASCLKVYSGFSLRRFMSYARMAKEKGYMDDICSYSTISNYMRDGSMKEALTGLIRWSSLPLGSVETKFAADSTGFSTCRRSRWYDHKYGRDKEITQWRKLHVMTGVKTNVITAASVTGSWRFDGKELQPLMEETGKGFDMKEISADKAYLSRANVDMIEASGATPFIPLKTNSTKYPQGSPSWKKMYHYFMFNQDEFMRHYHARSNVEATFSMIKAKFGDSLKSTSEAAQDNELLAKVVCHNICVLIQEMHVFGIASKPL